MKRQRNRIAILGVLVSMLLFGTGGAHAAHIIFYGEDAGLGHGGGRLTSHPNADAARADFLSYLVGVGTEDFEGIAGGTTTPLSLVFPGAGTATLSGSGVVADLAGEDGFGRFAVSGTHFLQDVQAPGFQMTFSDPVAALGFYMVDVGDFAGQITLEMVNGTHTDVLIPSTINSAGGTVGYFGVIDLEASFTSVSFTTPAGTGDFFAFDDMTIGSQAQVIPEPSILALLGIGLAGLGLGRRKRVG